MLFPLH